MKRRNLIQGGLAFLGALLWPTRKTGAALVAPTEPDVGQVWLVSKDEPREWAGDMMILHSRDAGYEDAWKVRKSNFDTPWVRTPGENWWRVTIHQHHRKGLSLLGLFGGQNHYVHEAEELLPGIQSGRWQYLGNVGEFLERVRR